MANTVFSFDTNVLLFHLKLLWPLNAAGMFKVTLHTFRNNVLLGPEFSYQAHHSEFGSLPLLCAKRRGHSSALQKHLGKPAFRLGLTSSEPVF